MLVRIICLLIGYAFGLIQTSYIIGKMHGIDIREYGSGNAGTTNAMRTLGRKAGFMTFAGDMLKCLVATLVVRLIFGTSHEDIVPVLCCPYVQWIKERKWWRVPGFSCLSVDIYAVKCYTHAV